MCDLSEQIELDMDNEIELRLECGCVIMVRLGDILDVNECDDYASEEEVIDMDTSEEESEDSGIDTDHDSDSSCGETCSDKVCFCP